MVTEYEKRRLVDWLRAEMTRQTGRRYLIDLESLDLKSLRKLQRLLRDLEDEARRTAQQARMFPWRNPWPHSSSLPRGLRSPCERQGAIAICPRWPTRASR